MAFEFVSALAEQRYTECAKVLDASIAACDPGDAQGRAEMLVNRGYCHQRVQLYRKALKVRAIGSLPAASQAAVAPGRGFSPPYMDIRC